MSTQIGELIFDSGKTLFEILDELNVPEISNKLTAVDVRLDEVNDQLRQLGAIVDSNQTNNNASFIAVNTQLDSLNAEVVSLNLAIAPLSIQLTDLEQEFASLQQEVITLSGSIDPLESSLANLQSQVLALDDRVSDISITVDSYSPRIRVLETNVSSLQLEINSLTQRVIRVELNAPRSQQLYLGNEYIFTYRTGGVPGVTNYYRFTYSGSTSTPILANKGYIASALSSVTGTATNREVFLAAPFDLFSVNGRYNYPMIQGPCRLSFVVNNTSPTEGYITTL